MVVDALAAAHGIFDWKQKFTGDYARGSLRVDGGLHDVVLLKPQTFMNASGDCVQPASAFFKVPPANLVVVHDELDVPWRAVRLKFGGGHAGHNGLRSLVARLGTADFGRVRVGIGRPPPAFKGFVADFVLCEFDLVERAEQGAVVAHAVGVVETVVSRGV